MSGRAYSSEIYKVSSRGPLPPLEYILEVTLGAERTRGRSRGEGRIKKLKRMQLFSV